MEANPDRRMGPTGAELGENLRRAAESGDLGRLKELLSSDRMDRDVVNSQNQDGDTALMCACNGGHLEAVKLLFNSFAKTDVQNNLGATALTLARKGQYVEVNDVSQ